MSGMRKFFRGNISESCSVIISTGSKNCLTPYISAVWQFARLLLTLVFALNYVYRNPGLFIFPAINLSGSCTGYLPVKKQLHVRLIHKEIVNDLKTIYKVISKPVFCFCNNSRLVFLGKNNLE
jgi:hypothetical protein